MSEINILNHNYVFIFGKINQDLINDTLLLLNLSKEEFIDIYLEIFWKTKLSKNKHIRTDILGNTYKQLIIDKIFESNNFGYINSQELYIIALMLNVSVNSLIIRKQEKEIINDNK
jgi:hypothetical protein